MEVVEVEPAPPSAARVVAAPTPHRLAADALRVFTGQTIWSIASVLAGIVIVRALGPAGKGHLAYAQTVVNLATTAFGGVATGAMLAVARRGVDRSAAERTTFRIAILAGAPAAAVLIAVGLLAHQQWPLIGAAAALVPALFAQSVQTMLQYRGDVKRAIVAQQIAGTGLALGTAAIVLAGGGLVGAFACWAVALVTASVAGMRGLHATSARVPVTRAVIAGIGVTTTLVAIAGYLNLTVDVYIVAAVRPAAELGIYTLAIASGEVLWQLVRALLWPALRPIAHLERDAAAALAARICRQSIALVGTAAVIAWFAAPLAIRLVYGDTFAPAGDVLRVLLPGIVAMAGEAAIGSYVMLALGRPRALFFVQAGAALACAAVCVIGLPRYGLAAAAFGTSVTYCAAFVAVIWLAARDGLPLRLLLRG